MEAEFQSLLRWISAEIRLKVPNFPSGRSIFHSPWLGQSDYAGWICSRQRSASGEVRVVEGDVKRRFAASAALNVDVTYRLVADAEHMC